MRAKARPSSDGWGCTCPAFNRKTDPALTLIRAAAVKLKITNRTVESADFLAGAGKELYHVTYRHNQPGGWCKHCAACAAHLAGIDLSPIAEREEEWQQKERETKKLIRAMKKYMTSLEKVIRSQKTKLQRLSDS